MARFYLLLAGLFVGLLVGLAVLLPVLGCGKATEQSKAELLQEEKLRLALMNAQQGQLSWLLHREQQVRAMEKRNEKAVEKLASERLEVRQSRQELKHQQEALKAVATEADARVKAAESRLKAGEAEFQAGEQKDKEKLADLTARNRELSRRLVYLEATTSSPRPRIAEEVPSTQREASRRADEQKKARQQYLEALADTTIGIVKNVPMGTTYENPETARQRLLQQFQTMKPTSSDEQFKEAARRSAEQFALRVTKGTLTEEERATIRNFEQPGIASTSP
jgi:hypothetical protein